MGSRVAVISKNKKQISIKLRTDSLLVDMIVNLIFKSRIQHTFTNVQFWDPATSYSSMALNDAESNDNSY